MKNGLKTESQFSGVKMVLPIQSYASPLGSLSGVVDCLLTRCAHHLRGDWLFDGSASEFRGQSLTGALPGTVSMSWTLFPFSVVAVLLVLDSSGITSRLNRLLYIRPIGEPFLSLHKSCGGSGFSFQNHQ